MKRLLPVLGLLCFAFVAQSRAAVTYNCTGADFPGGCSLQELTSGGTITINGILYDTFVWTPGNVVGSLGPNDDIRVEGVDSTRYPALVFTDTTGNAWNRSGLTVTTNHLSFRVRNQNAIAAEFRNFRMYAQFGAISVFDLAQQEDSNVFIKDRPFPAAFGDPQHPPPTHGEAVVQCFASEVQTLGQSCAQDQRRDSHTGAQAPGPFPPTTDMYANMEFNIIAETGGHAQLVQFIYQLEVANLVTWSGVPDMNGNGSQEIAVLREDKGQPASIHVEVRDSLTRARLSGRSFFDNTYSPIRMVGLPDTDGNGVPEIAVLAQLNSSGQGFIEIRNASGPPAARQIALAIGNTALGMKVIPGDIDNDGSPELAVRMTNNSDGQESIAIVDAFGSADRLTLGYPPDLQVLDFSVVNDGDHDGIDEIAALCGRFSDGRYVVRVRNAQAGSLFSQVTLPTGYRPIRIATVQDSDGNFVPDLAILHERLPSGATSVQVMDETLAQGTWRFINYPGGTDLKVLSMAGFPDLNGNTVPDIALFADTGTTARTRLYVDDASGPGNRSIETWPTSGYDAVPLGTLFIGDADGNGSQEFGFVVSRNLDGQLQVHIRNLTGAALSRTISFNP